MNAPPNRYRVEHTQIEATANLLSGLGYHGVATQLWGIAAELKERGKPTVPPEPDPVTGLRYSPLRPDGWLRRQARHELAQDNDPEHDRAGSWETCRQCIEEAVRG